jgi:uncharacterized coiled-coil DUF342 family protein
MNRGFRYYTSPRNDPVPNKLFIEEFKELSSLVSAIQESVLQMKGTMTKLQNEINELKAKQEEFVLLQKDFINLWEDVVALEKRFDDWEESEWLKENNLSE